MLTPRNELEPLAWWIRSDRLLYTQDEAVTEMIAYMDCRRKGSTIRERLGKAWQATPASRGFELGSRLVGTTPRSGYDDQLTILNCRTPAPIC